MLNALAIVNNPYQGAAKKVLCCCSAGLLRSPTAANVLHKEFGYNTRAVGLEESYALIPINEQLIHWADEIVVMTQGHKETLDSFIKSMTHPTLNIPKTIVLEIPDTFSYGTPDLCNLIHHAYQTKSTQPTPPPLEDSEL